MVTTARGLAERAVGHVPSETFELLVSALAEHAVAERREGSGSDAADEARKAIAAIRASTADWSLEDARRGTLVSGLRRTYERGAQQLALLRADPGDVEASHDWRKRVKDLWYQQRLIAPAWPAVLEAQAEEAHVLSEHLGDDHDLAVLEERLAAGVPAVAADLDPVVELIGRRRAELGERSLRLGARVYAESPRAFERRIAGYLAAWRSEVRADGITVP
jgi:CHAD domain-containing protein